jgi:hypothetical protein
MPCPGSSPLPRTRRDVLRQAAHGFGAVALAALWHEQGRALGGDPAALASGLHHPPRARQVIVLFMDGGPSQVDSFDPKPRLDRDHGKPVPFQTALTQFNNDGTLLRSPWTFQPHGQCGTPVSSLFPHIAGCVDDLAVVRSMVSEFSEHTSANYFMHTGFGLQGRPSHGAWVTYGLGSPSRDLPGFVVLNSGQIPPGGLDCFTSGFLAPQYQGSIFRAGDPPVANIQPAPAQARKLDLLRALDRESLAHLGSTPALESAIANDELACRMQTAVPELVDLAGETRATTALYGLDADYEPTRIFARQCLLARRLVERGVRFVEVLCPSIGHDRWDQHGNLRDGHEKNARAVDQPIAALLRDLKARGLLESTLVLWCGEFGRTPFAQGADGRDHNPFGFSIWLAGGGVKGGIVHGATDEFGYHAVADKVTVHDLHATMLHLLGIDHTRLTFRFSGRDMRLTDVHGEVVTPLLG